MDALLPNGSHPARPKRSPVNAKSSLLHATCSFQKLNFIVHVSLIVCVITFRVIVDILAWVSSVVAVVSPRSANRRTSATTYDVLVTIPKPITNFDNFRLLLAVYLYFLCNGCSVEDGKVHFMREFYLCSV